LGGAPPFRGRILTTCEKKRKIKIIGGRLKEQAFN
jgi:hypothetical protein